MIKKTPKLVHYLALIIVDGDRTEHSFLSRKCRDAFVSGCMETEWMLNSNNIKFKAIRLKRRG